MKEKLNPCPFCKSTRVKLNRNFDYVYCEFCGAKGSYFDGHPEDAIAVWNNIFKKKPRKLKRKSNEKRNNN